MEDFLKTLETIKNEDINILNSYNKINPYKLEFENDIYQHLIKDKYLFFDIFCKNNEVVMICPVYGLYNIEYDKIKVKHNDNYLNLKEIIYKIEYEPIVIVIFSLEENETNITLFIEYNNYQPQKYELSHLHTTKQKLLSYTTLFKYDYELTNLTYDYYSKQGVEHFYFYYNDEITEDITDFFANKNNITLIEWNFAYWNIRTMFDRDFIFAHHAQMGQLNHALYKYGKNNTEYMIFSDLDEFMYIEGKTIKNLVDNKDYDSYEFVNYWAQTINNDIPSTIPTQIYKKLSDDWYNRIKSIHRTDNAKLIGVHTCTKYNTKYDVTQNQNMELLHFYNWSKLNRKIDIGNNKYNLKF